MSKRLLLYVEGQTEELFVNRILRNHLAAFGVIVERPILAKTGNGPKARRGGFVNWQVVEQDLRELFRSRKEPILHFSTLLDLYGLPPQVPGYPGAVSAVRSTAEVEAMEAEWSRHFGEPRFVPYFQRHEFEALVIASPASLEKVFPNHSASLAAIIGPTLESASAEDVNDGAETHPSARLALAMPEYTHRKASYALFTLLEAGLPAVRDRCPRFDAWLNRWERWGSGAD